MLEDNFKDEEKIAGFNWVGRQVECYWSFPVSQRGFYPGIIRNYRRASDNDTEYLVQYSEESYEWEVIDDGIRFVTKEHEEEKKESNRT